MYTASTSLIVLPASHPYLLCVNSVVVTVLCKSHRYYRRRLYDTSLVYKLTACDCHAGTFSENLDGLVNLHEPTPALVKASLPFYDRIFCVIRL